MCSFVSCHEERDVSKLPKRVKVILIYDRFITIMQKNERIILISVTLSRDVAQIYKIVR